LAPAPNDYDVTVVGAGPIGLTLANLLGTYGVRTLLVERNPSTVQEPRAVSIDDESLRTMQTAGMVETLLEQIVAGYGSKYLDPKGSCFLEVLPTQVVYGYPKRNAFRQPVLEAQLRDGLSRFPNVETRFESRLDRYANHGDGVSLALIGKDGAEQTVRCRFLVGCDGAASTVRTQMGIRLEGETFSEKWLIVDLENSPAPERDTLVFCNPARPCIALPGPNLTRRFEFKLLKGESPEFILQPDVVQRLLNDHGVAVGSTIKRATVYTFHARLAPQWQAGRVFLAGDACHLTPPFAGQGMNSGVRDASNLAWKLAAVLAGRLGPGLLESYQRERLNHVREMIQLALRMGRIMGPPSRLAGAVTQAVFRGLRAWPPARDYFGQMKYKPKPRFSEGFIVPDNTNPKTTVVGRLLPQPEVRWNGRSVLLDEVLGKGFALVAITEYPFAFVAAEHPVWDRLGVRRVVAQRVATAMTLENAQVVEVPANFLNGAQERVLLVRPDRYVAAAFSLADMNRAAEKVQALCDATAPVVTSAPFISLAS
jgi:3-(3-hydroxy-phenyl)propionate hydroxylase